MPYRTLLLALAASCALSAARAQSVAVYVNASELLLQAASLGVHVAPSPRLLFSANATRRWLTQRARLRLTFGEPTFAEGYSYDAGLAYRVALGDGDGPSAFHAAIGPVYLFRRERGGPEACLRDPDCADLGYDLDLHAAGAHLVLTYAADGLYVCADLGAAYRFARDSRLRLTNPAFDEGILATDGAVFARIGLGYRFGR